MSDEYEFMDDSAFEDAPAPAAAAPAEPPPEPATEPASEPDPVKAEGDLPPAPGPEAAPTAKPDPEPSDSAQKPPEGFVPYGALAEARGTVKELRARLEAMEGAKAAPEPEPAKVPDMFEDPEGYTKAMTAPIEQIQREWAEMKRQQQIAARVQQDEMAFVAQNADYPDAMKALRDSRAAELQMLGLDQASIPAQINAEFMQIAETAYRNGGSAAEIVYKLAAQRGYTRREGGDQPDPAPAPASAKPAMSALERLANASRSVADAAGEGAKSVEALEDVAGMSPYDIAAMDDAELRGLMARA